MARLDWRLPAWELFAWEGSHLLCTVHWMCFPDHQFYFLMAPFSCNCCTAIRYHRNENVPHSDHTLRLLSCYRHHFVALPPPTRQRNALARLAGQNSLHWFWVSTWIILMSAHFVMCSSINWVRRKKSLPILSLSLLTKPRQFNLIHSGAMLTLVVYGVKNRMATL